MLDRLLNDERGEHLLEAARNLNGSAIDDYLERECGHDDDLRAAVQRAKLGGWCNLGVFD